MNKPGPAQITALNCPNCGAAVATDSVSCSYCKSAISARVCAACYGAVSVGMKHCPHCGASVGEAPIPKHDSLKCPRCDSSLSILAVGRNSMHNCTQCGGLWVDKDIFQKICTQEEEQEAVLGCQIPESPSLQEQKPRRAYIPCPQCGKLMNHKNFASCSGIVLDWCHKHGSWFDRQELHRVVTFIRGGGMRKARERELSQLQEQKDRLRMQELQIASKMGSQIGSGIGGFEQKPNSDPLLQFLSRMFL